MEERALGASGLFVSSIALGTMGWGRDTDIHEAREQFEVYYDAGGRFIDTADVYSEGASEEMVGEITKQRSDVLISSKAGNVQTARRRDNSRKHLLDVLDNSLRRLGRSTIDVWHLHVWDPLTPIDETLSAMDIAITSGRVRYIGMSNFSGWQSALAATRAREVLKHSPGFISNQSEYSLLQRGIEREVIPAAQALGMGIMAWSPLGRGVLTGKYRHSTPPDSRAASTHFASFVASFLADKPRAITEAVCTAAEGLNLSALQVSLNWVLQRPGVASAIVGARTTVQLRAILSAIDEIIPNEIMEALNEVSAPDRGYPEYGWNQS
ncbi:MAG: aldo/keto reductase [Actinobacteria bacterium]|uniref:Unannotated protein n=1 Tax=freshwater metagenome TaxID=449393 RepID=A0A6J5ZNV2_9ZZZZ|nr:aldo/keto reductase [Actinomycetota bacterium]